MADLRSDLESELLCMFFQLRPERSTTKTFRQKFVKPCPRGLNSRTPVQSLMSGTNALPFILIMKHAAEDVFSFIFDCIK